ncbi:hypothetical protein D3C76_1416550 [compost metagenome]
MGHVQARTDRICQGMHGRDRRIGESDARKAGAEQHVFPRLQVQTVTTGLVQAASEQAQRLARQAIGNGVLQVLAGIGFDGMHHGIDAGCRRDVGWQLDGQLGIEDGQVG